LEQLPLGLDGALHFVEGIQERAGLFTLSGSLEIEHFALAGANHAIGRFDLVEQRPGLDQRRA